jgi:Protein of unknown function (DUF1194)
MIATCMTRRVFGFGVAAAVLAGVAQAQEPAVDLALALAIDCSFSVDSNEFRIQMRGLGDAIASPEVWDAIAKGPKQKIALVIYQWSDNNIQRVIHPWTIIDAPDVARDVGLRMANGPRAISEGGTAISSALIFGAALFSIAPPANRRVIDLATDGRNNMGSPVPLARDTVVARGITINGLAIANEWPTLDIYVENNVAGGPANFVIKADSYDDFGSAMQRKLIREIVGPGLT